jgi:7,8-dihydroneopterin aldolase/epimerase/oxygenase
MDEIRVHGLALQCIVGIHAHERVNEQPLCIDLTLGLDTRDAARTGKISRTVHYGDVAEQVSALLRFRRYRLLEAAAEEIAWMLLGIHSRLEWVKIQVEKPQALAGIAQAASLTITRTRQDLAEAESASPRSAVAGASIVHSVAMREAELSVLGLESDQRWVHDKQQRRRLLWVLGGSVRVNEQVFAAGQHICDEAGGGFAIVGGSEPARVFFCHANRELG